MATMSIGFVTGNPNKLAEIGRLLPPGIALVHLDLGEVQETGETFEENAEIKARVGLSMSQLSMGEDSGLMVTALAGAPGVHSKRYAASDVERIGRLLTALEGEHDRRARFVTVIALASPDEATRLFRGEVRGQIAHEPRGAHGFGYDPVFIPDEGDGRTFAEMTAEEKGSISHRARAIRSLLSYLREQHP
ncbi:MAG: RdgB/HAM1 family non-canonical purine NTP pyrophosphatase [Actinobacteria bacterium]|jgi:XTP/dITP diphosphohydrolase|nr:RdgB/HAM1 family non-canonical purine NTP pyrophosphatase [Actinomycetota bacterium]